MPTRREVLRTACRSGLGLALAGLGVGCDSGQPRGGARPNVVFMLADDLGWGDLGCYGNGHARTPRLDAMANEGTLFTQFYVSSPVCSPTRAGFLAGVFPSRLRVFGHFWTAERNRERGMPDFLDPAAPTIPSLLRGSGYVTGHFGKWHLGSGRRGEVPDPGGYGIDEHATVGSSGPGYMTPGAGRADDARLIVDRAVDFVQRHRDQPFYLNVWFRDPHAPLSPTPEQMARCAHLASKAPGATTTAMQIYHAAVSEMDAQAGRLLAELDALGLAGRTLVLFASDNGPESITIREAAHSGAGSAGPFRGRKRSLYEGGIRVPLIVRWRGVVPRYRVDNQTVLAAVDLLPTLCELAGIRVPRNMDLDGECMADALLGAHVARRRPLMWEYRYGGSGPVVERSPTLAVREGRWKLLANPDGSRIELYDLLSDPMEADDRSELHPGLVRRLQRELLAWWSELPAGGPADATAGKADYPWPHEMGWLPSQ